MTIDLDKLEQLAQAATPGMWSCKPVYESQRGSPDYAHIMASSTNVPVANVSQHEQDAEYITAANPPAVLALIRRLRAAERVVSTVSEVFTQLREGGPVHLGMPLTIRLESLESDLADYDKEVAG